MIRCFWWSSPFCFSVCRFTAECKNPSKRLEVLKKSNDGFYLANADLKMRGPGDAFGVRQSGDISFKLADIYNDNQLLKQAAECVENILKDDPDLMSSDVFKRFIEDSAERTYLNL